MEIPGGADGIEGRFTFSGVDLAGNPSTQIAKVRYEHEDDGEFPTPRRTASYATTGGRFTTDTRPPEMPSGLQLEMRKLGVAVIQWKEPGGDPNSYNLYRSLTPITDTAGLVPVRRDIYATVIVDDPPVDGNYYYAVTSVDFAGNESAVYESKSVFIDTIKPELKIKAAPLGDDFVILLDEDAPEELSLTLRFPGQRDIQVELGGSSGELAEYKVVRGPNGERRVVLPQQVGFFNGKVEVIVHSPDPEGNVVEEKTELEMKQIAAATGGAVSSADEQVQLIIPPGLQPVIPEGPGQGKRVGGYDNIFFIKYANIPKEKPAVVEGEKRRREDVDPLPPGLEIIGVPYVIEMNQPPEEPLELKGSATQADLSQLKPLMAKLKMKVPQQYSDAVEDPDYLKSRLRVMQWVPVSANQKAYRREPVPDVEIDPEDRRVHRPRQPHHHLRDHRGAHPARRARAAARSATRPSPNSSRSFPVCWWTRAPDWPSGPRTGSCSPSTGARFPKSSSRSPGATPPRFASPSARRKSSPRAATRRASAPRTWSRTWPT
ncbi:MAG: hypothetical protein U1F77_02045 [Kiritimatiellia bacterium]